MAPQAVSHVARASQTPAGLGPAALTDVSSRSVASSDSVSMLVGTGPSLPTFRRPSASGASRTSWFPGPVTGQSGASFRPVQTRSLRMLEQQLQMGRPLPTSSLGPSLGPGPGPGLANRQPPSAGLRSPCAAVSSFQTVYGQSSGRRTERQSPGLHLGPAESRKCAAAPTVHSALSPVPSAYSGRGTRGSAQLYHQPGRRFVVGLRHELGSSTDSSPSRSLTHAFHQQPRAVNTLPAAAQRAGRQTGPASPRPRTSPFGRLISLHFLFSNNNNNNNNNLFFLYRLAFWNYQWSINMRCSHPIL
ncbi:unnamed protein product [Protopolystoma xenopodis]|uniref:Uncharacterized protein n=1 Tax=Protopolystoma xenopodis TaxID=117903 RepID=A0A3S5C8J1_9PLAT|nr:unnamed protein product [Protopolystoma xenopodis]